MSVSEESAGVRHRECGGEKWTPQPAPRPSSGSGPALRFTLHEPPSEARLSLLSLHSGHQSCLLGSRLAQRLVSIVHTCACVCLSRVHRCACACTCVCVHP